jgi:hypothetical protein
MRPGSALLAPGGGSYGSPVATHSGDCDTHGGGDGGGPYHQTPRQASRRHASHANGMRPGSPPPSPASDDEEIGLGEGLAVEMERLEDEGSGGEEGEEGMALGDDEDEKGVERGGEGAAEAGFGGMVGGGHRVGSLELGVSPTIQLPGALPPLFAGGGGGAGGAGAHHLSERFAPPPPSPQLTGLASPPYEPAGSGLGGLPPVLL